MFLRKEVSDLIKCMCTCTSEIIYLKMYELIEVHRCCRLHRDLRDLEDVFLAGCSVMSIDAASVIISVSNPLAHGAIRSDNIATVRYRITVSTYYPHVAPKVVCLDSEGLGMTQRLCLDSNGLIVHPVLLQWSAIMTLENVITMLIHFTSGSYETSNNAMANEMTGED